eukprot:COSAG01_NODE_2328_length_7893_cov_2.389017_3_plen_167_part_00
MSLETNNPLHADGEDPALAKKNSLVAVVGDSQELDDNNSKSSGLVLSPVIADYMSSKHAGRHARVALRTVLREIKELVVFMQKVASALGAVNVPSIMTNSLFSGAMLAVGSTVKCVKDALAVNDPYDRHVLEIQMHLAIITIMFAAVSFLDLLMRRDGILCKWSFM